MFHPGRMREARELCELVGQPWRAASLGGGGGVGPLPLGAAADEADAMDPAGEQAQDLATEVRPRVEGWDQGAVGKWMPHATLAPCLIMGCQNL